MAHTNRANGWDFAVDSLFGSVEFGNLVPSICSGNPYYWGTHPAIAIPGRENITSATLQARLDQKSQQGGGTVTLEEMALVRVTQTIRIPNNVKLKTDSGLIHNQYARMARLVRTSSFMGVMVEMKSDSSLEGVWIDGRDSVFNHTLGDPQANIKTIGKNISITNTRNSDTTGGTHLVLNGTYEGVTCTNSLVKENLITGYANSHYNNGWADGITIKCEDTIVENNDVIDATDVGIIVFTAYPATQKTKVRFNTVLNAGNSGYGSYGIEPWVGNKPTIISWYGDQI